MSDALPTAPEAEKNLLGCVMLTPGIVEDVLPLVDAGDFHDDRLRLLFGRAKSLWSDSKRLDITLLVESLRTTGDLERIGGMPFLAEVAESVANAAHATFYAKAVREASQRRKLVAAADQQRLAALAGEPIETLIATAEKQLRAIEDLGAVQAIATAQDAAREGIERVFAAKEGRGAMGIESGLADYDRLTGGWHPGELIVIAGRPGDGKSTLGMQTAVHVAEGRRRVLYVSLEMSAADLALRQLAGDAAVSSTDVRGGTLTDDEIGRLVDAGSNFGKLPLHLLDATRCSVADVRRAARQLQRAHGDLALVAIDYLGLLKPDDARLPRHEQVSAITRDLKQLARDMQLPVLCLAQLNRGSEQGKGRPKLSNLRESGSIEQDADVVLFLHRPETAAPNDPDVANVVELIVAKNRSGPTGDIELFFDRSRTRFATLERRYVEFDAYNAESF